MANSNLTVISIHDGWQSSKGISWRHGATLQCRSNGEPAKLGQALERKLNQVKELMSQEDVLKFWYSYQVSALLVALSVDRESVYKSTPRLQPRQGIPNEAIYRFAVYLGPEKGSYAIEGFALDTKTQNLGAVKQYTPISWSNAAETPV